MDLVSYTSDDPRRQLACDEALLRAAVDGRAGETLRLYELRRPAVVLGIGLEWRREANADACGADGVPILTLMSRPPWDTMPVLTHGAGGDRTDLVCGHLHSEDPLFDPAMRALPPVFVVRVPDGPAARWVASSINYALAVTNYYDAHY